jgi:hypothetical protein
MVAHQRWWSRIIDFDMKCRKMKPWKSTVHQLTSVVEYFDMFEWDDLGSVSQVKQMLIKDPRTLPSSPGVYKIVYGDHDYIGRAIRYGGLRRRIKEHLNNPSAQWNDPSEETRYHVKIIAMDEKMHGRLLAGIVEAVLIELSQPTLNRNGKRG